MPPLETIRSNGKEPKPERSPTPEASGMVAPSRLSFLPATSSHSNLNGGLGTAEWELSMSNLASSLMPDGGSHRDLESEGTACSGLTAGPDAAAVLFDYLLGDEQTEARAFSESIRMKPDIRLE